MLYLPAKWLTSDDKPVSILSTVFLLTVKISWSQFESLAGFSAVIDRLGEFSEVVGSYTPAEPAADGAAGAADAGAGSHCCCLAVADAPDA